MPFVDLLTADEVLALSKQAVKFLTEEQALAMLLEPSGKAEGHASAASPIFHHNRVTRTKMQFIYLNLFSLLPWDNASSECHFF